MTPETILNYVSGIGIGAIIGIFIKALFDRNAQKRKMLFDERVKAYANVFGKFSSLFATEDYSVLFKAGKRAIMLRQELAPAFLVGSAELNNLLSEYMRLLDNFYEALDVSDPNEPNKKARKIHSELNKISRSIQRQMRKDIFVIKR